MPAKPSMKTYQSLLAAVKGEIEKGRKAIGRITAQTYWRVGQHISRDLLANKEHADYGAHVIGKLVSDTGISRAVLYDTVDFYRKYQKVPTSGQLGWSQYRELLSVGDRKKRLALEHRAQAKNLTARQVRAAAQKINEKEKAKAVDVVAAAQPVSPAPHLKVTRGRLRHIQLKTVNGILQVDCGFKVYHAVALKGIPGAKEGDIVEYVAGVNGGWRFKRSCETRSAIFTYVATLERVVDADTLAVVIDAGFNNTVRQKLRFRHLNAPEIKTSEGKLARDFVVKELSTVKFFVIKTYGYEKYDRTLTDLFYLPGETDPEIVAAKGVLLNQRLFDAGLAVTYQA